MKNSFRQSMAWLHSWVGLALGWLMFIIFVMGTASYFRLEITQWMQPEIQFVAPAPAQAANVAVTALNRFAPQAISWYVELPTARQPVISTYWQESGINGAYRHQLLDPYTGEKIQARDTLGGDFFYQFHYQLYGLPSTLGSIVVGITAMAMFVALISGVITHKKIFKDFFTFRPHKGQRSWLDLHNLTAVVALPFFIMITYTGLAIFFYLYMPWGIWAKYGSNMGEFFNELQNSKTALVSTVPPHTQAMPSLQPIIQHASVAWQNGSPIGIIEVDHPNTDQTKITFSQQPRDELNSRFGPSLSFVATTGNPSFHASPDQQNNSTMTHTAGVVYGLHQAQFASWPLRWLLFCSGLLGSAMIATGLILWIVKRRTKNMAKEKPSIAHYVVERLNIAVIVGLPFAIAVFFWANRLLPLQLTLRPIWEIRCFLGAWVLVLFYGLFRSWQQAWRELLIFLALLYLTLPILNLAMNPNASLLHTLGQGHTVLAAFDLTILGLGLLFACAAYIVIQPKHSTKHAMRRDRAKSHANLHHEKHYSEAHKEIES